MVRQQRILTHVSSHDLAEAAPQSFQVTLVVCCAVLCCVCCAAFELILEPIISDFDPQLVIISAGFDAAEGDFLGK